MPRSRDPWETTFRRRISVRDRLPTSLEATGASSGSTTPHLERRFDSGDAAVVAGDLRGAPCPVLSSGWLKEVAPENIFHIAVTLDTSHLLSGWLKEVA